MRHPSGGCAFVALELLLSTGAGLGDGGLTGRARGTAGGVIGGGEGAEGGCKETEGTGVAGGSAEGGTATGMIGAAGGMSPPCFQWQWETVGAIRLSRRCNSRLFG